MQIDPNSVTWDPAPAQPSRAPGVIRGPAPTLNPREVRSNDRADRTEARTTQQNTFRTMTPDEVQAQGLPDGGVYQINGLGEIKTVTSPPKSAPQQNEASQRERLARIETALENLQGLEQMVKSSDMGTGSIVGQEKFRSGDAFGGLSSFFNQTANNVSGSIEMVQGDLINQVRSEMQESGAPIGVKGADTEKEASRLAASIANMAQTQDEEQFLIGLRRAQDYYSRRRNVIEGSLQESVEESAARVLDGQSADVQTDAANKALGRLLQSGATKDEILALAKDLNLTVDEAALDANIRSRDEGGAISTFVSGGGDTPSPPDDGLTLSQIGQGLAEGTGDVVQGLGGIVGIVADPLARTLSDVLGYDSSQLRSTGTAIREDIGLPQSEAGIGRSAREFAAGSLSFAGAARGASNLMANALSRNSLSQVGRTPVRDTIAGAGAGAGSEIGEDLGGTPGQVAGMLAGGIGGYAGANRLASAANRSQPNALLAASQRQNVDLLPADAGGPVAQAVTVGTRASPLSVAPVAKAAENQQQQFGQAARRVAVSQGEVLDTEQAGEAIRRGAKNFIEESQRRGNRLYERAFEQSRGVKIKANQTSQAARDAVERLKENPAATPSEIQSLQEFAENISGGVSIRGLREARTKLSQSVYDGNMRSSSDQAMWKGILSNVADDIDAGLRSVGRDDAANTFRVADRLWSERIEVIDQVLQPIIGKEGAKGGEQILQAVESAARGQSGGNARLSRILGAMPKEEAASVRATIADRLGRATPGAQDAQGEVFSASTFLTNWNKLTPQAKTSLFPTKQMRDNLNDLAKIAEGTKRSQAMANTSNTGVAMNASELIRAGVNVGVVGAGAATSIPFTILGAGGVYATGKLMASPGFARLLARTSKMPPEAANRTFREQLALLSTREPLIADDIAKLTNAINDNGQLAAQDDQPQN